MAIYFPIYLKYKKADGTFRGSELKFSGISVCRMLVNPTSIEVKKTPSISVVRTMGGNVFQSWPNKPDEISFNGIMYGTRSLQDFRVLQNSIDNKPDLKEVILQYKWKEYHGYIQSMSVSAKADDPRVFNYDFSFLSKDAFSLGRMMLGQITGYQAEVDYFKGIYYGIKNQFVADPVLGALNVASFGIASVTMKSSDNANPQELLSADKIMNSIDATELEKF